MTESHDFEKTADQVADKAEDFAADAQNAADEFASGAQDAADETAAKADDAKQAFTAKASEIGEKLQEQFKAIDKVTPKEFGDMAVKFASDTAYAAAGFANLVAEKAREFADKQKVQTFADTEAGNDHGTAFIDQLNAQFNKFVEDLGHTYKDLADRGRDTVAKMQQQASAKAEAPKGDDAPGPFDIVDDAETAHESDKSDS